MSDTEQKIKKRQSMRRKVALELLIKASKVIPQISAKKIEEAELIDGTKIFLLDNIIQLFSKNGEIIPTLMCQYIENIPSIIVDMGAIPFICKGADVMIPGIKKIEGEFIEGSIVVIKDVNNKKAISIGKALVSSNEIMKSNKGKAIQNLHYVGDKIWVSKI
ncbi:RNA-binding protein [Candidatus Bathyarchaeota archaeon]|nr:RNA-binding protein [Candidatus Bathyarchaeota archaeon]